jgi:hypothetical protein
MHELEAAELQQALKFRKTNSCNLAFHLLPLKKITIHICPKTTQFF